MERFIKFINMEYNKNCIAADLYVDDKFIVRLLVKNKAHLISSANTNIGLYEYFRIAMLENIDSLGIYKIDSKTIN
jgi:hypothetical protein